MVFATSAMPCWGNKSMTKIPRACQKQFSNQHPNLHLIWSQLASILGGFWEPSWSQVGTKSLQKSIQKDIKKMITFWIALGSNFHGFWPPFGSQDGAQNPHLGAKIGPRPPKVGTKIGSKPQLGAKMAPRPSQDTSRDLFWMILASILDCFLMIFEGFWWSFLLLSSFILASILLPFCIHFYVSSWLLILQSAKGRGPAMTRRRRLQ